MAFRKSVGIWVKYTSCQTTAPTTMNATTPSHDYGGINSTGTRAITNAATIVEILKGAWDKSQNISYQPADLIAK